MAQINNRPIMNSDIAAVAAMNNRPGQVLIQYFVYFLIVIKIILYFIYKFFFKFIERNMLLVYIWSTFVSACLFQYEINENTY